MKHFKPFDQLLITHLKEKIISEDSDSIVKALIEHIKNNQYSFITNLNAYGLFLFYKNSQFRNNLLHSTVTFIDGFLAKYFINKYFQISNHRNTPPDFLEDFFKESENLCIPVIIIGYKPSELNQIINNIQQRHSKLKIRLFLNGYLPESHYVSAISSIQDKTIVLIGMGMPLQENIARKLIQLNRNLHCIPLGNGLKYYSGIEWRAPKLFTDYGFEWFFRLCSEPLRMGRRNGRIVFFIITYWISKQICKKLK